MCLGERTDGKQSAALRNNVECSALFADVLKHWKDFCDAVGESYSITIELSLLISVVYL